MAARLHEAVIDGNADIARELLNAGANPLALDEEGHTPAFYAFDLNKPELYAVLVVRRPEILDNEMVPRIQNMPDPRQKLAFLNAITAEIERLQDNDAINNVKLNPKISELIEMQNELNFAEEEHGMLGARRRRRRHGRGRKTVKARKSRKARKRRSTRRR